MGKSKTSNTSRDTLDRRRIAEQALLLIDKAGLEQLSMRKLGAALGVEGMALYHHFGSKGELLDAVLELLLEEMTPPQLAATPLEKLRTLFTATRQVAIRHPQAFLLIPTRRFTTKRQLDYYEQVLGMFRDAGLDAEYSAMFFRVLAGFTTGACLAEIGSRAQQPDATPIRLEHFKDAAHYPLVSAVVPHLRVAKLSRIFEFGLDLIFAALEQQLGKQPKRKRRKQAK